MSPKEIISTIKPSTAAAGILLLAACSSISPSGYVSPRVTGRVVDAQTHQPLSGVLVRRLTADAGLDSSKVAGGGHLLQSAAEVRTGRDGQFVLPSMRAIASLGGSGWYSVTLAFERSSYETFTKSYTLGNATNSAAGEPLVETGDVPLVKREH